MSLVLTLLVLLSAAVAGCAGTGAPNVPGTTLCNDELKSDIRDYIWRAESQYTGGARPKIKNTRFVAVTSWGGVEEWTVERLGVDIYYPVGLIPLPDGTTIFAIRPAQNEPVEVPEGGTEVPQEFLEELKRTFQPN